MKKLSIAVVVAVSLHVTSAQAGDAITVDEQKLRFCLLKVSTAAKLQNNGDRKAALWQLQKAGQLCQPILKQLYSDTEKQVSQ